MKKIFLIALAVLGLTAGTAAAQDMDAATRYMLQNLPNDPAVRVGRLENGLTYYIRQNALPEKRAEFYLATNVGGIQETPDQDGLAHFLEHMCFNGTEHFPGKAILDYLRSIGAEFGRNINASTGFEETQYMLNNIPIERETVIDTCLMILADYSHYVLNEPEEIDAERGVILEERRSRRNAQWRLLERSLPYYFGDCKYATCTLIGSEENLKGFQPASLTNFYHTWYYPGNQAVVVIGDVDVDRIEAKIKSIFGPIPGKEPVEKPVITVPAHSEPVVGVLTDPEETSASVSLLWMGEATPEEYNPTRMNLMQDLLKQIVAQIMRERFQDITADPESPYQGGSFGVGSVIYENTEAVMADVTLREDNILGGFYAFCEEIERMRRFGFADDEVERAKTAILNGYENRVKRAATRKNSEFVYPILSNFFDKTPFMAPEDALKEVEQLLPNFNAAVLSMVAQQLPMEENLTILYTGPEKAGLESPTEEQLLAVFQEVRESDIKPSEKAAVAEEFLDAEALSGSQVESTRTVLYGTTEWTLANGIKVYVLPTKHTENQILFNIFEEGGLSLISEADIDSFDDTVTSVFESNRGLSSFSGTDVTKMLAGKSLSVSTYIGTKEHGVQGQSTIKDLETAFQLIYLNYADPRFDQKEWDNGITMLKQVLPNQVSTPNFIFGQKLYDILFGGNPRRRQISMETLEKANLATYERGYRKLFGSAAGARMVIVGDVDIEALRPIVEKYIGSLPTSGVASKADEANIPAFATGRISEVFATPMETPMSTVLHAYILDTRYDYWTETALEVMQYVLDMRYTASLREEEGGTYGASTMGDLSRSPKSQAIVETYFNCNPDICDRLRELTVKGITDLANEGLTDEEFNQAVLNLRKNLPENRISNNYWMNNIENWIYYAEDADVLKETSGILITKEYVQQIAKQVVENGSFIEIVQTPAAK